jgi:hypothetical protein
MGQAVADLVVIGKQKLTSADFSKLAGVPPEVEEHRPQVRAGDGHQCRGGRAMRAFAARDGGDERPFQ